MALTGAQLKGKIKNLAKKIMQMHVFWFEFI